VVAECLDLGLPDRAQMVGLDVADLETFRQRRIELIVESLASRAAIWAAYPGSRGRLLTG